MPDKIWPFVIRKLSASKKSDWTHIVRAITNEENLSIAKQK